MTAPNLGDGRVDELTAEFVTETRETLERISEALLSWEADPANTAQLDEIFRFVHTVKGSCGFLDLQRIGALAHAAETALGAVRAGSRPATATLVGALLAVIDRIALLSEALESKAVVPEALTDLDLIGDIDRDDAPEAKAAPVVVTQARSVRVAVDVLETAMTQVSDLVLARNELSRCLRDIDGDVALTAAFDRVSSAIGDIRETIARTRMQPIDRLFALLPRLARDTANTVGKSVQLRIEGSDVEIDREMIEAIRDPLTHIVRNAIDHGIENAVGRAEAGKDAIGTLTVSARQSGNQVSITVTDDGRGIDVAKLIQKAVASKILAPEKVASLTQDAALNLIFAPGLSTVDQVTEISGRGVGMDVVRANIERLGGAIAIENRPGRGLAITLRAPLTLSIMNALLVEAGNQMFAVPRAAIHEIVSVKSSTVRVEPVGAGHIAVIRGRMLSVVSLAQMLGLRNEALSHLVVVDPPGGNRFALGVALVRDHEELVVRPTAPHVAALGTYAGQSLPDNGVPILVIDTAGVAARAGIDAERRGADSALLAPMAAERKSLLLFDGLDGMRRAIRTTAVMHIDDVEVSDFVSHDGHYFVVFDGNMLPIVLDGELPVDGRVALLRLDQHGVTVGYPVATVHDLAPISDVSPVDGNDVDGFVLIDGRAVPLIAWPRRSSEAALERKRA